MLSKLIYGVSFALLLLIVGASNFHMGATYAANNMEPVYIEVPVPVEREVEKLVDRSDSWESEQTIGVLPDASVTTDPVDFDRCSYLIHLYANHVGNGYSEPSVYLPWMEGGMIVLTLRVRASDYRVEVTRNDDNPPVSVPGEPEDDGGSHEPGSDDDF